MILAAAFPLLAALGTGQEPAAAAAPQVLHVSGRGGSDAEGDGTAAAPYRSLTRALRAAAGSGPLELRVDVGTYSAASGEEFPLRLANGTQLLGLAPQVCRIEAGGAAAVLDLAGGAGRTVLADLTLTGAETGVQVSGWTAGELVLRDVRCERLGTGLAWEGGSADRGSARLRVAGARFRACSSAGVRATGVIDLQLSDARFENCGVGLEIPAIPLDESGRPLVGLRVEGCVFADSAGAGVRIAGLAGPVAGGRPFAFAGCEFRACDVGLQIERPAGDHPLELRGCRFSDNLRFGLALVGANGDPAARSLIEDCRFTGNGVGLHLVNTQLQLEVRNCRILESQGNGVFFGNFLAEPSLGVFVGNLIAGNGAAGLYALSDGRNLRVIAEACTVAGNAASGIQRREKHGGTSGFDLRGCIVAGNGEDLVLIGADEVHDCWIGVGTHAGENGNRGGDAAFVDAAAGDYRLRADSPCRLSGAAVPGAFKDSE
ncbi:MAG TPA: right-handed parallel beta-helix repeat-containing protein [Planctomycetota bacterium]